MCHNPGVMDGILPLLFRVLGMCLYLNLLICMKLGFPYLRIDKIGSSYQQDGWQNHSHEILRGEDFPPIDKPGSQIGLGNIAEGDSSG